MRTGDESVKKIYFWSGAENFFLFCSCVAGTCLLDPPPSPVPYELSPGKLAARSAHIWSQRKAPAAGWHHTQTHGPVKVWEPAFGWKQWRRCSQRRSLLRRAFAAARWHVRRAPFTFHGYAARPYCYLQVVIFQANVNRFIIRLRGAGWYIYINTANTSHVCLLSGLFLSALAAELQNPQPVSEVNVSFINHKRPLWCREVQPNGLNLLWSLVGVSLFCLGSKSRVGCWLTTTLTNSQSQTFNWL